jgi:putative thioredoxin
VFQGQPVADLSQARTEGQLKQMLDQLLAQLPIQSEEKAQAEEIAPHIIAAEELLATGEFEQALARFDQIAGIVPDEPQVVSGQARALIALGHVDEAAALLDAVPEDLAKDAAIERARAALTLARNAKPVADLSGLEARVAADADDHAARFELAGGYMANSNRDAAADALLEIVKRDRAWNDGAAKTQFLTLLEAVGLEDPWTGTQRRRLSAILFS